MFLFEMLLFVISWEAADREVGCFFAKKIEIISKEDKEEENTNIIDNKRLDITLKIRHLWYNKIQIIVSELCVKYK